MRTRLVVSSLLSVLSLAAVNAATLADGPLNLTGWTEYDPDDDWVPSNPTPTSVRLDENVASPSVHPGWIVSDFTLAATCTISFDLLIDNAAGDDDFMGLGFSWSQPGPDVVYSYLLDWKKGTQSFNWGDTVVVNDDLAEAGMKIKRINGTYTWDGLWGGVDGLGVTTIAGPVAGGWNAGTTYHFDMTLEPGRITVVRDGVLIFDVIDASFAGGAGSIAVYGFSQDNITLSNVFATPAPVVCPGDFNDDGIVDGSDLGSLLGAWGTPLGDITGDGTTDGADLGAILGAWGPCT
ncbi:MAG: hypothetical protein JNM94_08560 [Phycisphaerae bacterium]|nr:hypothetical protein [Phycisphaerae bacterium]